MSACSNYEIVQTPVGAVPRPMLTFTVQGPAQALNLVGMMDSVPEWSPIVWRGADGFTNIDSISELFEKVDGTVTKLPTGEEVKLLTEPIRVPQMGGYWGLVKHVLRHPYRGKMRRIRSIGGVVDVTPNHSIFLRKRGKKYGNGLGAIHLHDAKHAELGDGLDVIKVKHTHAKTGTKDGFFVGTEELAWMYGFFAAEGSTYDIKVATPIQRGLPKDMWTGSSKYISFSNGDIQLLEKAKRIFEANFHSHMVWSQNEKDGKYATVYKLQTADPHIYQYFSKMFYTQTRRKKVPREILNAPLQIKKAFLDGYNAGDGAHSTIDRRLSLMQYQSFTTNSWVLAQGLLWLSEEAIQQTHNVLIRDDKPDVVEINFNTPKENRTGLSSYELEDRRVIKKIIDYEYGGYVYDLETQQHRFTTGIGNVMVHNTGSDVILLPLSVGQALGFNPQPQTSTFGVSGSASGQIFQNIQITVAGVTFNAPIFVATNDDAPILLGRAGVWSQFDSFTFHNTEGALCFGNAVPQPISFQQPSWMLVAAAAVGGIVAWLFLR